MLALIPLILAFSAFPARLCAAIPRAEVEAAVGHEMGTASEEYSRFEATCSYSGEEASVTISIRQLTEGLDLKAELANLQGAFPEATLREVAVDKGRAFALEIPGVGAQIHVVRSEREYWLVSVAGVGDVGGSVQAALRIARAALSHSG